MSTPTPCAASPGWPRSDAGDQVLEIGAGLGSLTLALAETGASVRALEIDRHLIEPLRSVVEPHGVTVHHANALEVDYAEILHGHPTVVVANLPYNVATPVVLHLFETQPLVTRMLVMVQKEVGERLAARAGDDAYGAASLRVQYFADARVVGKVPPSVFCPAPQRRLGARRPCSAVSECASTPTSSAKRPSSRSFEPPLGSVARCCAARCPVGRARGSLIAPALTRPADPRS